MNKLNKAHKIKNVKTNMAFIYALGLLCFLFGGIKAQNKLPKPQTIKTTSLNCLMDSSYFYGSGANSNERVY